MDRAVEDRRADVRRTRPFSRPRCRARRRARSDRRRPARVRRTTRHHSAMRARSLRRSVRSIVPTGSAKVSLGSATATPIRLLPTSSAMIAISQPLTNSVRDALPLWAGGPRWCASRSSIARATRGGAPQRAERVLARRRQRRESSPRSRCVQLQQIAPAFAAGDVDEPAGLGIQPDGRRSSPAADPQRTQRLGRRRQSQQLEQTQRKARKQRDAASDAAAIAAEHPGQAGRRRRAAPYPVRRTRRSVRRPATQPQSAPARPSAATARARCRPRRSRRASVRGACRTRTRSQTPDVPQDGFRRAARPWRRRRVCRARS